MHMLHTLVAVSCVRRFGGAVGSSEPDFIKIVRLSQTANSHSLCQFANWAFSRSMDWYPALLALPARDASKRDVRNEASAVGADVVINELANQLTRQPSQARLKTLHGVRSTGAIESFQATSAKHTKVPIALVAIT